MAFSLSQIRVLFRTLTILRYCIKDEKMRERGLLFKGTRNRGGGGGGGGVFFIFFPNPNMIIFLIHRLRVNNNISCLLT